jgi:hypothetical protein
MFHFFVISKCFEVGLAALLDVLAVISTTHSDLPPPVIRLFVEARIVSVVDKET